MAEVAQPALSKGRQARMEVASAELDRALNGEVRQCVVQVCRHHGTTYACLNLEGYRTGSMNEVLPVSEAR